jgi:hypothetical protein
LHPIHILLFQYHLRIYLYCSNTKRRSAILFQPSQCHLPECTGTKEHIFAIYDHFNVSLLNIITLSLFLCVLVSTEECRHFLGGRTV